MESITEQRFVDRLLQALATLPQNQPRAFDPRVPQRTERSDPVPASPVKN